MARAFLPSVKRLFLLPVLATLCMGATLQRLSMDDMIVQSHAIVRAKVVDSYAAYSDGVIYTHYKLQVSERYKGAQSITEVVVPGGIAKGIRQVFSGAPHFEAGGEYVFFLWTSKAGLTQTIGLTQGVFAVTQDGSGDPGVTRGSSRELMLEAGTGHPVKDQTLAMHLSELKLQIATTLASQAAKQ